MVEPRLELYGDVTAWSWFDALRDANNLPQTSHRHATTPYHAITRVKVGGDFNCAPPPGLRIPLTLSVSTIPFDAIQSKTR